MWQNNVLDVARYIVHYCQSNSIHITSLKLQKLLYFTQVITLVESKGERACFKEDIVAWHYGPAIEEVYYEYSKYGSSSIRDHRPAPYIIGECTVRKVLGELATLNSFKLTDITRCQRPWIEAFAEGVGTVIPKEEIYNFFKN